MNIQNIGKTSNEKDNPTSKKDIKTIQDPNKYKLSSKEIEENLKLTQQINNNKKDLIEKKEKNQFTTQNYQKVDENPKNITQLDTEMQLTEFTEKSKISVESKNLIGTGGFASIYLGTQGSTKGIFQELTQVESQTGTPGGRKYAIKLVII